MIGSWNGSGSGASAPIRVGDIGQWVHLAGVYDGRQWMLYRNGALVAVNGSSIGAVAVNGDCATMGNLA